MKFQISEQALHHYLERRKNDLGTLREALVNLDFARIQFIAHQLKGNASTFGFPELGEHAAEWESHSLNQNIPALGEEFQWFEGWLREKISF